jgi:radical SAM superfamily enzyme YgiQ (UPF0313 family)
MKNILLINPPVSIYQNRTAFIPLPLLILGTCLKRIRQEGTDFLYEVIDLDLMLKQGFFSDDSSFYKESSDLILKKNPDILLFTVHGLNHIAVLNLAERIKKKRPCLIVAGGVGPTLKAKEALTRCANIDIIVKGEGEPVLKHLIPAAINNGDYAGVPSIVYRKDGQVIENPRSYLDKNEPIPVPDYSLVRIEDYIIHNQTNPYIHPGFVLIESGRGCPNRCTFCAPAKMWAGNVRYRPVAEIIDEMKFLAEKGGTFSFFTQDNLEENFLSQLSESLIKENTDISWGCYSRLDRLSDNMAGLLSKAGCELIFTGFETPNLAAQKKIRKVINSISVFEKLKTFNDNGIRLIGSFIAGFSDETEVELDNTMRFAIECAVGQKIEKLNQFIAKTDQSKLPQTPNNICVIHPLFYMPGTDSFNEEKDKLHISKYSLHPDCYGSFLFGYNEFKDDWSFLGSNPYLNHLPEKKVRYYCSILRLFNFLNSRPYYFALLMFIRKQEPLAFIKEMVSCLGEEFVLSEKVEIFEAKSRDYVKKYLEFVPEWTVKKGQ